METSVKDDVLVPVSVISEVLKQWEINPNSYKCIDDMNELSAYIGEEVE